ncbi:HK97 family phage prohead protease [Mycobacterium marinum]|uniref:HK97 family phage prohead protease n=1 Tax=Mycobacterium marinum TaxID=1781 RepID=UPI002359BE41|nr:HK97 family phage prohead protease [Mycobacterium marinum]WCS20144.1 HK97 family phage prohead protease [Mycobacterium marinum]
MLTTAAALRRRLERELAMLAIEQRLIEFRLAHGTRVETRTAPAADVDTRSRIITVIAVPYESPAEVAWRSEIWTEIFSRGAFTGVEPQAGRIRVNRDHNRSRTVGKVVRFDPNAQAGLIADIRIAPTALGDETLALAADDCLSASVGFAVPAGGARVDKRTMTRRINTAILDHVALVESPAYAGASVQGVA